MAFCANCGSQVEGRFCAKCGTPVATAAGAAPGGYSAPNPAPNQASQAGYAPPPPPPAQAAGGLDENMASALCYLLGVLTGVLFLVLEPYNRNRNIRFHAFQSIFVWLGMIAVGIVITIVSNLIAFVPFVGWLVYIVLWGCFALGSFGLWLMLMYKAYNNERWVLPVVGPLAEKQV